MKPSPHKHPSAVGGNPFAERHAEPPPIILLDGQDDAWSRSVRRDVRNDLMWTGIALGLLGLLAVIGAVTAAIVAIPSGNLTESNFWIVATIVGGGILVLMVGVAVSVIRFGDRSTLFASTLLGIGLSVLSGVAVILLLVLAGVIFLLAICLSIIAKDL